MTHRGNFFVFISQPQRSPRTAAATPEPHRGWGGGGKQHYEGVHKHLGVRVQATNFSLLHGASHPEVLIERASQIGVSHLGIVDRDCVYGLVRAHTDAKAFDISFVCGAAITVEHHPPVMLLVENHRGWTSLSRLLTAARAETDKGYASVTVEQVTSHFAA